MPVLRLAFVIIPLVAGRSALRGVRSGAGRFHGRAVPDGNGWLLQEVTLRLPGRVDPVGTTFASASDLATALQRGAAAHGKHEERTGEEDADWPAWYAEYMVREQAGQELPT